MPGADHVYHLYVARHERRDELAEALGSKGVASRPYYARPVHRQPGMADFAGPGLPGTDLAAATNLALPMGTELTEDAIAEVVAACDAALAAVP